MLFSVIVPVYNTEKFLKECLDSIIHQSFTDFEVIIVDDGSRDLSPRICDEYVRADDRFKCVHIENGGLANARNTGIDMARGQYICFVDSDDIVGVNFLQDFYNAIGGREVEVVHAGLTYSPSGKKLYSPFPMDEINTGIELLQRFPNVSKDVTIPFSVRYCLKKDFLDTHKLRFNTNIKYAEDSPFNITVISLSKKMTAVHSAEYVYKVNSQSINGRYKPTMIEDLDYLHKVKFDIADMLNVSKNEYIRDIVAKEFCEWLPACVNNFKNSEKGYKYSHTKKLLKANFVQDGAKYILSNKLYERKLGYIYLLAIKLRIPFIHYIWKNKRLSDFIYI